MIVSRRHFIRAGGLGAAALALSACGELGRQAASQQLPESLDIPENTGDEALTLRRLLNRGGFGPRPGDLARAAEIGLAALLEEQLNPASIDDNAADLMIRNLSLYPQDVGFLLAMDARDVAADLILATVSRAIYSRRQLYEVVVEFWSDHFNIYLRKNERTPALKLVDDRDVIRPNALGRFRDLLSASAHSPAMLVYLDNVAKVSRAPNANYARELMELHTLGVDSGYTQDDVRALARILTGWGVRRRGLREGQFAFFPEEHDGDAKLFLGRDFPAGRGEEEVVEALEMLVTHPSTPGFVARKLVRRFVADDPPQSLVDALAQTFRDTDGDIPALLRALFLSAEFADAPPKLKRPFTFMLSALRALHADVRPGAVRALMRDWLTAMGQPLFLWPPPDGYPVTASAWAANLLPRWNFAIALLTGNIDGVSVPLDRIMEAAGVTDVPSALDAFASLTLARPHGTPPASRDVPGERGRLSRCIWNLGFFPNDARKNCPFVLTFH